ncbi:MAG: ATP cone domain-containing protein [Candidatus Aenigmatarchaeota archaeon]
MTQIIKKDGTKEEFSEEKLRRSIESAAEEAGIEEERIREVVDQVSTTAIDLVQAEEEMQSNELREKILTELDTVEPAVSDHWRKYDETKKAE